MMRYFQDTSTGTFFPIKHIPGWVNDRSFYEVQNGDRYYIPLDEEYIAIYQGNGKWLFSE